MGAAKGVRLHHETKYNKNITKIKINQYKKLDGTKQNSEDDSATFCFVVTFIMILRSST